MTVEKRPLPKLTAGMLWHSPNSANLGVGALTLGNMALAREAAERAVVSLEFHLLGFADPGKPAYVTGSDVAVTALDARAFMPGGSLGRALAQCDLVLDIGGGDSFTDIYGPKRFGYLWASKLLARAKGKPLILSPQTIGPFGKVWSRLLASYILGQADMVFARDPKSLAALSELGAHGNGALATDVAFALPYEQVEHGAGVHVGINVSGLLFNGGYSGRNEFGMEVDYPAFTRKLIAALSGREGVTVHLVPHVLSDAMPQDDDRGAIRTLAQEFPGAIVAPDFAGPIEAKSYIAGLDMLVGGRMHACIAAHSSRVAVVPVAYSRKFAGLFEGTLGYRHLIPVTGMSTDEALDYTLKAFDDRAALAGDALASGERVARLLEVYRAALAETFVAIAMRKGK